MHDWKQLVRAHLRGLELSDSRREEIVAEFACHLEDHFNELRRRGLSEMEAIQRAFDEIPNWRKLSRRINRATREEDNMTQRTKSLWIPGFSMVAVMLLGLIGAFRANMYPEGLSITSTYALLIYVPWLASLPLIGAVGTLWSRRMGGKSTIRLRACTIPVAVLTALFLVSMPFRLLWVLGSVRSLGWDLSYLIFCLLFWAVYPSLALLFGALPFLLRDGERTVGPVEAQN